MPFLTFRPDRRKIKCAVSNDTNFFIQHADDELKRLTHVARISIRFVHSHANDA